jgi:CRP/FNR family cyclic AMP-dependent transcriptional regulator
MSNPDWIDAALYLASVLVFVAFFMKAIVPLRVVAIGSNIAFIGYAIGTWNIPILVLHIALLPLNITRTVQHLKLARAVRRAVEDDIHVESLLPIMKRKTYQKGTVLFSMGDQADAMYFLVSGKVRFPEIDVTIGPGNLFGEMALFLKQRGRTSSAVCVETCELCTLSDARVKELAVLDPAFGLFLTKLIAARMNENILAKTALDTRTDKHVVGGV